jgi:hypothetical protein
MRLALNITQIAQGGFSQAAIDEMQYLIKKPQPEVREQERRGIEFPGHEMVTAVMERHLAMIHQNYMDGCLPCQHATARKLQTRGRHKRTGAP